MASGEAGYPQHPRSTGNRLKARVKYDYEIVHSLVDATPILHVSFAPTNDDPFPVMLPMLGATGVFDPENPPAEDAPGSESEDDDLVTGPGAFPDDGTAPSKVTSKPPRTQHSLPPGPRSIYLHGHAASRLFQSPSSATTTTDAPTPSLPVTIAASSMQGIVLALSPFHNSCNYSSAIVHGYAIPVTSEAERLYALTLITDNLVPGRWANSRHPPTDAELKSTGVLRVEIVSASAKIRQGEPGDDRHDLKDEELVGRTWTGVVPTWMAVGEPVASSYNRVGTLPRYLRRFVDGSNTAGKREAAEAIEKGLKK